MRAHLTPEKPRIEDPLRTEFIKWAKSGLQSILEAEVQGHLTVYMDTGETKPTLVIDTMDPTPTYISNMPSGAMTTTGDPKEPAAPRHDDAMLKLRRQTEIRAAQITTEEFGLRGLAHILHGKRGKECLNHLCTAAHRAAELAAHNTSGRKGRTAKDVTKQATDLLKQSVFDSGVQRICAVAGLSLSRLTPATHNLMLEQLPALEQFDKDNADMLAFVIEHVLQRLPKDARLYTKEQAVEAAVQAGGLGDCDAVWLEPAVKHQGEEDTQAERTGRHGLHPVPAARHDRSATRSAGGPGSHIPGAGAAGELAGGQRLASGRNGNGRGADQRGCDDCGAVPEQGHEQLATGLVLARAQRPSDENVTRGQVQ